MKLYCYYESYDYEGNGTPYHFFSREELFDYIKKHGVGGDAQFLYEIDTTAKTEAQVWYGEFDFRNRKSNADVVDIVKEAFDVFDAEAK